MMRLRFKQFCSDRSGSAAMLFGLAIVPFTLMLGVAVDYSRATTAKSALQQVTDAATLAVAKGLNDSSGLGEAKKKAANILKSDERFIDAIIVDADLSADKKTFCLTTRVSVPTVIMQVAGFNAMQPGARACAEIGNGAQRFEIALALDNSGSMNESAGGVSKIQALRTAASNFVDSMFDRSPNKVKVSIAPFAGLVVPIDPHVAANRTLPWIDVNGQSSQHWLTFVSKADANANGFNSRFDVFNNLKTQRADWDFGGCFEPQTYPMNVTETVPTSSNADTLFVPYFAPDEPDSSIYENNYLNDDGGGCSMAVSGSWNDLTRACKYKPATGWTSGTWSWYGSSAGNGWTRGVFSTRGGAFNGPNGMCPNAATQTLMQLSTDKVALKSKITQLAAAGDTNLHEGLMWAWRSISPHPPFSAGAPYSSASVKKILVLMTDGYNNWSSNTNSVSGSYYQALGYYSYNGVKNIRLPDGSRGNGVDYQTALNAAANSATDFKPVSRQAQDELTAQSCENAKKAGIEVYTIGFSVPTNPIDAAGINLLRNCATNTDHYFMATNAGEIDAVFAKIAGNMAKLRLTQ